MLQRGGVVFRGTKRGFTLVLSESMDFDELVKELEEKLAECQEFVSGAYFSIDAGERVFNEEETFRLRQILEGKYDMKWRTFPEKKTKGGTGDSVESQGHMQGATVVKHTLRSGQRIDFDGSVVVLGDVNSGAEIFASGDIIVFGTLRGLAHAGINGDESRIILANRMRATQLRIAGVIGRAPDSHQGNLPNMPEVARIKSGVIVIEDYFGS